MAFFVNKPPETTPSRLNMSRRFVPCDVEYTLLPSDDTIESYVMLPAEIVAGERGVISEVLLSRPYIDILLLPLLAVYRDALSGDTNTLTGVAPDAVEPGDVADIAPVELFLLNIDMLFALVFAV